VLRTLEDLYGLPYAGESSSATPIAGIFASCGNSVIEGVEQCDTGPTGCTADEECVSCACVAAEACSSGIALTDVVLSLVADPFVVRLKARAVLPVPFAGVDPPSNGVRVVVDSPDGGGFDAALPGGDAWTANAAGTRWTYRDPAGSAGSIVRAVVVDRSAAVDGQLRLTVKGRGGSVTIPAPSQLRTSVVFGASGECATADAGAATLACSGDAARVRCR
jgi:hypothetical protein